MTPHPKLGTVVVLTALVLVGACGSNGETGGATTAGPTNPETTLPGTTLPGTTLPGTTTAPTEVTTAATKKLAPKVGEVLDFVPNGGRADEELVAKGTPLRRGSLLAADPGGTVDFKLDQKIKWCQARPGSQVRVVSQGGVLLDFVRGTVWCGTRAGGGPVSFTAGGLSFQADDPVFSITVDDTGRTDVRVLQGFLRVGTGSTSVTLGEGQRAAVAKGKQAELGPFGLGELPTDNDNAEGVVVARLLDDVVRDLPALRYPATPTLGNTLLRRGPTPVRVAVVGDDQAARAFTQTFFEEVVGSIWNHPTVVPLATAEEAKQAQANGDVDVVVRPAKAAKNAVPLFQDPQDQVWRAIFAAGDAPLQATLEDTLRTALQGSCTANDNGVVPRSSPETPCYARLYQEAFGSDVVPFTPFTAILGLG